MPLFSAFETPYSVVFAALINLSDAEVEEVALVIREFVGLCHNLSPVLQLRSPLKLHVLAVHVLEFCASLRCTPASYGEQDSEACHRQFALISGTFRALGPRALLHTVNVFDASRF